VRIPAALLDPLLSDAGKALRNRARASATSVTVSPTSTAPTWTPTPQASATPTSTPTAEPTPEPAPPPPPPPPAPDCAVLSCVALTFDDGPGIYTAQLLDELAARGVKATFFVVGLNVAKYPELLTREVAEGHAIGNHTWAHADLTRLSEPEAAGQIDLLSAALAQTAGVNTTLVRTPYGARNDAVLAILAARGDAEISWNVDTEDWKNRDVATTTARALAGVSPGSIVLMHDIHPSTVEAVPGIIDQLQAAGYTLVTIPELLGPTTPGQVYRHR